MHMGLWALVVIYALGADTHNIYFADKSNDQHTYALHGTGHALGFSSITKILKHKAGLQK